MNKTEIYYGARDQSFINMIRNVLLTSKIKPKFINILISNSNIQNYYSKVFTHSYVDNKNNYEIFEFIGDSIAQTILVQYFYKKFPQLNCIDGLKILARLKINYGAKNIYASFGNKLGFWPFISASLDDRNKNKLKLLEDTFEAFIGATSEILDSFFDKKIGVGINICYDIMENLLNQINFSFKYEDLYDAKTRLKEMFDKIPNITLKYNSFKTDDNYYNVIIYKIITESPVEEELVNLSSINEKEIEQKAYNIAIEKLMEKYGKELFKLLANQTIKLNYKVNKINNFYNIIISSVISPSLQEEIGSAKAILKSEAEQMAAERGIETLVNQGYKKIIPEFYNYLCK